MNARILVDRLNQQLPHPVLIENQGGGGGVIAARAVANAAGRRIHLPAAGPGHAAQAFMHKQPPFDPIRDFIPVALVAEFPLGRGYQAKLAGRYAGGIHHAAEGGA
jgi:tripartite-type tricarboxylate transporter receptor subunit TctC